MRKTLLALLLATDAAMATDKNGYSWSNPTPDQLLRPMATDRPDATESPTTVDAGRVQIEMSFAQHTRDRRHPDGSALRVSEWNVFPVNFRLGLTHDTELQVVVDNYIRINEREGWSTTTVRHRGWGDITLRMKRNFFGNDGGESALALMPFVKLPTNSGGVGNSHFEGGLILPASITVAGRAFGVMTEVDIVHDGDGYEANWLNTITTGVDLSESLGAFVELASLTGAGSHELTFNAGVTYALNDDLQLDAGVNIGLTRAAPDLTTFAGISARF